jgi:hypothetical protein
VEKISIKIICSNNLTSLPALIKAQLYAFIKGDYYMEIKTKMEL